MPRSSAGAELLGASRLVADAVAGVGALVQEVHMNVLDTVGAVPGLGAAVKPVAGVTALVYRGVASVSGLSGRTVEGAARRLVPLLGQEAAWPGRETVLAALNGVLGDRLADSANPLTIGMRLRVAGTPSARIVLLAHGLCMHSGQWLRDGVDHGAMLARERACCPVYLDYNSGRHIAANGRELAQQLETLVDGWPVPVREIVIVGHSMGGLVGRSACLHADQAGLRWRSALRALVFLGTPHHGAPLERGGNWIGLLTESSRYSAPFARLARLRSAGITDLRHGSIVEQDGAGRDRFDHAGGRTSVPPPAGVRCLAIAATLGQQAGDITDRLAGDGLVPLDSALGEPGFDQQVVYQTGHLQLLASAHVGELLLDWLDQG